MSVMASTYPIVLAGAEGPVAVVVGGGRVAERKIRQLLEGHARVCLVSPEAGPGLRALAAADTIAWEARPYRRGDLSGATLAFAATDERAVNHDVAAEARERGIPCNVADVPGDGTFIVPAVLRTRTLMVAVSTYGSDPGRAAAVRDRIALLLEQEGVE
jgi:siroheme synthase-like protein